jgi:hypothetical protein
LGQPERLSVSWSLPVRGAIAAYDLAGNKTKGGRKPLFVVPLTGSAMFGVLDRPAMGRSQ